MNEIQQKLWSVLHNKFCVELKEDFSSKNAERWLNHFAQGQKIDVHQYGKDLTGKSGKGKTIRLFTGNWFTALLKGRIPATLMAKMVFKRLAKQNYSHSEVDLLGIQFDAVENQRAKALVAFTRVNQSGETYESAIVVYSLLLEHNRWLINQLVTYDTLDQLPAEEKPKDFWKPT